MSTAGSGDLEAWELAVHEPEVVPARGRILIEVPHGATEERHFRAVEARLRSDLPPDLREFFFVNTDVGAPEVATAMARRLAAAGLRVEVLRGLVPRTFVDLNRSLAVGSDSYRSLGVTPAVPSYVEEEADRRWLAGLHAAYQAQCERLFDEVSGGGGLAVALHTYAPRSIALDDIDRDVVEGLRRAWAPERVESWPLRPEVDLITKTPEGEVLADRRLVSTLRRELEDAGYQVGESATYRLIPGTMAAERSLARPGRVLCLELRRDLLVERWIPLRPLTPGAGVDRAAAPLVRAIASWFQEVDADFGDALVDEGHRVDAAGDRVTVSCPCCGESVDILIDPETEGELVQDCEVCCRPWELTVTREHGSLRVDVEAL